MRKLFTLLFVLVASHAFAQDILVKNGTDTIRCKILDLNDEQVTYQTQEGGITLRQTLARKYVTSYMKGYEAAPGVAAPVKKGGFRMALGGGPAIKMGKADPGMASNWRLGYTLGGEIGGYFDEFNGLALTVNYISHSFSYSVYGDKMDEKQNILYVGPTWIVRYGRTWVGTAHLGLGAVFMNADLGPYGQVVKCKGTAFGTSMGVGIERKISPTSALGASLSMTGGKLTRFKDEFGKQYDTGDNYSVSLTSLTLTAYIAFGSKK